MSSNVNKNITDYTCPLCGEGFVEELTGGLSEEIIFDSSSTNMMITRALVNWFRHARQPTLLPANPNNDDENDESTPYLQLFPGVRSMLQQSPFDGSQAASTSQLFSPSVSSSASTTLPVPQWPSPGSMFHLPFMPPCQHAAAARADESIVDVDGMNAAGVDAGTGAADQRTSPADHRRHYLTAVPRPMSTSASIRRNAGYSLNSQISLAAVDEIVIQLMREIASSSPPATASEVRAVPTINISGDQLTRNAQCTICMDDFTLSEPVRCLPCSHLFHSDCIVRWLEMHATCPVCRTSLTSASRNDTSSPSAPGLDTDAAGRIPNHGVVPADDPVPSVDRRLTLPNHLSHSPVSAYSDVEREQRQISIADLCTTSQNDAEHLNIVTSGSHWPQQLDADGGQPVDGTHVLGFDVQPGVSRDRRTCARPTSPRPCSHGIADEFVSVVSDAGYRVSNSQGSDTNVAPSRSADTSAELLTSASHDVTTTLLDAGNEDREAGWIPEVLAVSNQFLHGPSTSPVLSEAGQSKPAVQCSECSGSLHHCTSGTDNAQYSRLAYDSTPANNYLNSIFMSTTMTNADLHSLPAHDDEAADRETVSNPTLRSL